MLGGLLFAPVGLIIPAIIRYLIVKKPISKVVSGIIVFLNLVGVVALGIIILRSMNDSGSYTGVSIGGAISAILAFKMLTESNSEPEENNKLSDDK